MRHAFTRQAFMRRPSNNSRRLFFWNPSSAAAWSEIGENHKRLGDTGGLKLALSGVDPRIADGSDTSRYHRAQGYYYAETEQYELAAAHFMASTYFGSSEYALSEIVHIKQATGQDYAGMNIEKTVSVLEQAGVSFTADPDTMGGRAALIEIACEYGAAETAIETAANMFAFTGDKNFKGLAKTLVTTPKEAAEGEDGQRYL